MKWMIWQNVSNAFRQEWPSLNETKTKTGVLSQTAEINWTPRISNVPGTKATPESTALAKCATVVENQAILLGNALQK
jgi:hypothetical protein